MTTIILTGSFPGAAGIVAVGPSVQLTDTTSGQVIPVTPVPCWLNSASRFVTLPLRVTDDPDIEPPDGFWSYLITITLAGSPPQSLNVLLPSALGPTADLSDLVPVTPQPQVSPVFPYLPIPSGTASAGDIPVATGTGALTQWSSSTGFTTAGTGLSGSGATISLSVPVSVPDGGTGATSAGGALTSLGAASSTALAAETSRAETAEAAALQQSASLSDLASAATARANLGLGTAATQASSAFDAAGAASSLVGTETTRAETAEALLAPKASPALTGTPTAPTATALTDGTQIATTAYADSAVAAETSRAETAEALKAPLASPALTGTPTAPTAVALTDSTQVATTAYTDAAVAAETSRAETAEAGLVPLSDLPLSLAHGGTGQTGQQAAINALTGSQSAGKVLRSDGTNATLSTIQSADVPTLNQSTTGTAAGLSSTLAIGSGGTGQVTQQAAINALTGTQSAGKVLRSDGTNATLSAIQASDVPTLNQSTSGTAAGLSATLAITSGGTGQASASAGFSALSPLTTSGDTLYGGVAGAGTRLAGNTSATKNFYTQTGTGSASAAPAWGMIASGDVPTLNQNTTGTAANITDTLDQVPAPAASVSLNSHKITSLASGTASTDAAAFGQIPVIDTTAADIKATSSAASAGSSAKTAAADHVHLQSFAGALGDGSDGAVVLDGTLTYSFLTKASSTYTFTRDMFAASLTISSGVTLNMGNARTYCTGTLTNNGSIISNGNAGQAGGTAGAAAANWSFHAGAAGGAGNTGAGSAGTGIAVNIGGSGGGAGGTGSSGAAGAAGTNSGSAATRTEYLRSPAVFATGQLAYASASQQIIGGCGGGGGGGDGSNKGGGGGAGGGVLGIAAASIINNGVITATGGAGGTPATGNCGGGGGGGGGVVWTFSLAAPSGSGSMTAAGGTAGSGIGTGTSGAAGSTGTVLNVVLA